MTDLARDIVSQSGNPKLGLENFDNFCKSFQEKMGYALNWNTKAGQYLARVFGNSHILSDRLIANPGWALDYFREPYISKVKSFEHINRDLIKFLSQWNTRDLDEVGQALRHFKYREMLRIIIKDLCNLDKTDNLLKEWSDVAAVLIKEAYNCTSRHISKSLGESCPGAVIALGKLGGGELNLSSDIDLLFIYESDDDPSSHQHHVKVANYTTRLLNSVTDAGFVFRVDHDLRPEGKQGPLANSLDAIERYYEYFGHDWERQALIRARPVAGNLELGNEFINRIRPFVFRKTLEYNDLIKMKQMKESMSSGASSQGSIDLKHGDGGIREVEFLVQALQMIYGGNNESLRVQNTFEAIDQLSENRLIHPLSAKRLKDAYSFLRRSENMIQMVREQQTHRIPRSKMDKDALANRMGFKDTDAHKAHEPFEAELLKHMKNVSRLFDGMFESDYERIELHEAIDENLESCSNEEEELDSIPWFKKQETNRIAHLDLEKKLTISQVLGRLTLLAEVIISVAYELGWKSLTKLYGSPLSSDGSLASLAIIGMGKLGSKEIDYGSDLDLCFVYSAEGHTGGQRRIANSEFFTRLARRIISILTIRSRYGKAYDVDSDLRPSGRSGTLVSTHDSFIDYHLKNAQPWERFALMRARIVAGEKHFGEQTRLALEGLAFELPPPPDDVLKNQMREIKQKIKCERSKDSDTVFDLKDGLGGTFELDTIIQYHQLKHVSSILTLRTQNTFHVLHLLHTKKIIRDSDYEILAKALEFNRRLISLTRLLSANSPNELDMKSDKALAVAKCMGYNKLKTLIDDLIMHRNLVHSMFVQIFEK